MPQFDGILALDRMERAVERVRDRLLRSTAALEAAAVPYAVIGGNAVMAWVEQVDEAAVRFTQDVDLSGVSPPPRSRHRHVSRRPRCQGPRCGACDLLR